jgi:hypothetical protein
METQPGNQGSEMSSDRKSVDDVTRDLVESATPTQSRLIAMARTKRAQNLNRVCAAALSCAALGRPVTIGEMVKFLREKRGSVGVLINKDFQAVEHFLRQCAFLPWLNVELTLASVNHLERQWRLTVDHELKDICDGRTPRPELGQSSMREYLAALRKEIDRRRKEAGAKRAARNWNVDAVNKAELVDLLNYIEAELDRLSS